MLCESVEDNVLYLISSICHQPLLQYGVGKYKNTAEIEWASIQRVKEGGNERGREGEGMKVKQTCLSLLLQLLFLFPLLPVPHQRSQIIES